MTAIKINGQPALLSICINTRACKLQDELLIKFYEEICRAENKPVTNTGFNQFKTEVLNAQNYYHKTV
jgi:hypothetical protein